MKLNLVITSGDPRPLPASSLSVFSSDGEITEQTVLEQLADVGVNKQR